MFGLITRNFCTRTNFVKKSICYFTTLHITINSH